MIFGVSGEVGPQLNHLSSKTKMVNVLKVLQIRFQDHISEQTTEEKCAYVNQRIDIQCK